MGARAPGPPTLWGHKPSSCGTKPGRARHTPVAQPLQPGRELTAEAGGPFTGGLRWPRLPRPWEGELRWPSSCERERVLSSFPGPLRGVWGVWGEAPGVRGEGRGEGKAPSPVLAQTVWAPGWVTERRQRLQRRRL